MKPIFIVFLSFITYMAVANDSIPPKSKIFKINLSTTNTESHKGYLNYIDDSSIFVTDIPVPFGKRNNNFNQFTFPNIYKIEYNRKNSLSRGFLYGCLSGAAIGAIIGLATYEKQECAPGSLICLDFGPGYNAMGGALVGSLGGGLIGIIIGASAKKTFILNRRKDKFDELKINILQRAYGNHGK